MSAAVQEGICYCFPGLFTPSTAVPGQPFQEFFMPVSQTYIYVYIKIHTHIYIWRKNVRNADYSVIWEMLLLRKWCFKAHGNFSAAIRQVVSHTLFISCRDRNWMKVSSMRQEVFFHSLCKGSSSYRNIPFLPPTDMTRGLCWASFAYKH